MGMAKYLDVPVLSLTVGTKVTVFGIMNAMLMLIGPLLDDRLKENLKNPETLTGCPLYSLSCLSVCLSASELQSTPLA